MIKAIMKNDKGNDIILLGFEKRNIELLKQGKPISIKGSMFGIEKDILIIFGETRKDMIRELAPLIDDNTKFIIGDN